MPNASANYYIGQLRAAIPGVAITEQDEADVLPKLGRGLELRLRRANRGKHQLQGQEQGRRCF